MSMYKVEICGVNTATLPLLTKEEREELWLKIKQGDKEAREKGEILHRYITEPYADGKAIYQIIKVNKKTVRIKVCLGIGDEWVLPMFGEECLVDRNYIEESLKRRDFWLNK